MLTLKNHTDENGMRNVFPDISMFIDSVKIDGLIQTERGKRFYWLNYNKKKRWIIKIFLWLKILLSYWHNEKTNIINTYLEMVIIDAVGFLLFQLYSVVMKVTN